MAKKKMRMPEPPDDDGDIIFRKTIRLKNGRVLVAAHYGLVAFPIKIRRRK